jgi:phosphatidylserine synthase
LSIGQPEHFRAIIITLVVLGLASDIFDGIIARWLNVSTSFLGTVIAGGYLMCPVSSVDKLHTQ